MVLDNLNTQFKQSFSETFTRGEYQRLSKKIQFFYPTKHASWLNLAIIEINLLDHEYLKRNIGNRIEPEKNKGLVR